MLDFEAAALRYLERKFDGKPISCAIWGEEQMVAFVIAGDIRAGCHCRFPQGAGLPSGFERRVSTTVSAASPPDEVHGGREGYVITTPQDDRREKVRPGREKSYYVVDPGGALTAASNAACRS
ncbi:MAG: hypothetical protein ACLTSG_02970 [Lachnospiraceae bacterium]